MKILTPLILAISLMITSACIPEKDNAEVSNLPVIEINDAYSFATMPGAATGAAFMMISNVSDIDDALISAESDVAKITEIHENTIDPDDGKMMMRRVKQIDIPAGKSVSLKPKGYHVMFIKMNEPLTLDSTVDITLNFEKSGAQKVTVQIKPPGMSPKHMHH